MRLFVAADLSRFALDALERAQQSLKVAGVSGDYVSRENLLEVIAFIGEVDEPMLDAAKASLMYAVEDLPVFSTTLGELVSLKTPGGVVCCRVAVPARMRRLQTAIVRELEGSGITCADDGSDHAITLVRNANTVPAPLPACRSVESPVRSVSLYALRTDSGKEEYEKLYTACLLKSYCRPQEAMLFLDADSCPFAREAIFVARKRRMHIAVLATGAVNLTRYLRRNDPRLPRKGFWVATINVEDAGETAASRIAALAEEGDVIVTNDRSLAKVCHGKGSLVLNSFGAAFGDGALSEDSQWASVGPRERLAFDAADPEAFQAQLSERLQACRETHARQSEGVDE